MVKIIMGLKGSGKTKKLVDMVRESVAADNGDIVVIEKDKKLTYDIPYQARLINASEYPICSYEFFKGLICGIHAGNYDITHIYIDNFLKLVDDQSDAALAVFLAWLDEFGASENIEFVLSVSADVNEASEGVKKYVI